MTIRLRFIKPWGPYKVGEIKLTESPTTVMWLVERHKVAVIDEPEPIAEAPEPVPETKFLRKAPRDKMQKSPVRAKSWRRGQSGGE